MAKLKPIQPAVILLFVVSKPDYRQQNTLTNFINKVLCRNISNLIL